MRTSFSPDTDRKSVTLVFAFGLGNRFGNGSFIDHRRSEFAPDEINRNPGYDDDQPGPGARSLIDKQNCQNYGSADDVQNRQDGIAKCFVWALDVGSLLTQDDNSGDGENIKNQRRGNHVV